jgi:hypothetical protein
MSNEVVRFVPLIDHIEAEARVFKEMSTLELREELGRAFKVTVQQIIRIAAIIRVLEDRGEKFDDTKSVLMTCLRKIAAGELMPQVLMSFNGSPSLLGCAMSLPIDDQKRLSDSSPLTVMELNGDEAIKHSVLPSKLTRRQVEQVFASDHIRSGAEQVKWLREQLDNEVEEVSLQRSKRAVFRQRLSAKGQRRSKRQSDVLLVELSVGYLKLSYEDRQTAEGCAIRGSLGTLLWMRGLLSEPLPPPENLKGLTDENGRPFPARKIAELKKLNLEFERMLKVEAKKFIADPELLALSVTE